MKLAASLLVGLVLGACALAPEAEIVTEKSLKASPDRVYAALVDGAAYPEWNPFIVSFEGAPRIGETIEIQVAPANGEAMSFSPEILAAAPGRELRWRGSAPIPGVFDGEHYFILEPEAGGARLIHGERFSGVALWFMDVEDFRADFEAMNGALAAHLAGAE